MRILSTTHARKHFATLIDIVRVNRQPIVIGRHNRAEVLLLKFPENFNAQLDEITNINEMSGSFDFLEQEPDLYTKDDIFQSYV